MKSTRVSIFKSTRKPEKQHGILELGDIQCPLHSPTMLLSPGSIILELLLLAQLLASFSSCSAMVHILRPPSVTLTNTLLMASGHLCCSSLSQVSRLLQKAQRNCKVGQKE